MNPESRSGSEPRPPVRDGTEGAFMRRGGVGFSEVMTWLLS
jgi:hypothetical protein